LQKSLLASTAAARGLTTPHDEVDEEAAAGDGEARTSAASAHAGIAGRAGEEAARAKLALRPWVGWGAAEQEVRFRRLFGFLRFSV
jgi:hypothetical protein